MEDIAVLSVVSGELPSAFDELRQAPRMVGTETASTASETAEGRRAASKLPAENVGVDTLMASPFAAALDVGFYIAR